MHRITKIRKTELHCACAVAVPQKNWPRPRDQVRMRVGFPPLPGLALREEYLQFSLYFYIYFLTVELQFVVGPDLGSTTILRGGMLGGGNLQICLLETH